MSRSLLWLLWGGLVLWGWGACVPELPQEPASERGFEPASGAEQQAGDRGLRTEPPGPDPLGSEPPGPEPSPELRSEVDTEPSPEPQPPERRPEPSTPDVPKARSRCDLGGASTVGQVSWGRNNYIKYIAGDLPLIFAAPHGGSSTPSEIPDRSQGVLLADSNSREVTLEAAHVVYKATGRLPHIILNRLHRKKLDANREIVEAAQGNGFAEQAWREFHRHIDAAKTWVTSRCKRGHFFDFHTNAHAAQWTEMGVLLSGSNLKLDDATLGQARYRDRSSYKALVTWSGLSLVALVRGPLSMGGLLMARGYKSIPSPKHPDPGSESYFSGGYNTARHGSRDGGTIDATQIETYTGFSRDARSDYSAKVAQAILGFVEAHYGFVLRKQVAAPSHSRCAQAKALSFDGQGQIVEVGSTLGADNQHGASIRCGRSFAMEGPQVYYRFPVTAGSTYEIQLFASFPARFYAFGTSCDAPSINAACQSGIDGPLVSSNSSLTRSFKAQTSGHRTLAIDSRSAPWYGSFRLSIKRK